MNVVVKTTLQFETRSFDSTSAATDGLNAKLLVSNL